MARATRDTLDALRELRNGPEYVAELRARLAAGLAVAVEQADTADGMQRQQAQGMVPGLRAGVEAVDGWVAQW